MMAKEKKVERIIAGIFFIVCAWLFYVRTLDILFYSSDLTNFMGRWITFHEDGGLFYASRYIIPLPFVFLAVGIIANQWKIFLAGSVLGIIWRLGSIVSFIQFDLHHNLFGDCFADYFCEVLFLLLFVFLSVMVINRNRSELWNALSAVTALCCFVSPIVSKWPPTIGYIQRAGAYRLIPYAFLIIAVVLSGLVFSTREKKAHLVTATPELTEGTSTIDKLVKLKSLLDSGAITQEEFNTKKKEILEQ